MNKRQVAGLRKRGAFNGALLLVWLNVAGVGCSGDGLGVVGTRGGKGGAWRGGQGWVGRGGEKGRRRGDELGVVGTMGGKGRGCVSSGRRAAARRRRSVFFVRARSPAKAGASMALPYLSDRRFKRTLLCG